MGQQDQPLLVLALVRRAPDAAVVIATPQRAPVRIPAWARVSVGVVAGMHAQMRHVRA